MGSALTSFGLFVAAIAMLFVCVLALLRVATHARDVFAAGNSVGPAFAPPTRASLELRDEAWAVRWSRADRRAARPWELVSARGDLVLGPAVRWGESPVPVPRPGAAATLSMAAVAGHLVVVGDSGSGKTTLLERLGAALVAREPGRLVILLDCKGGPDSPGRGAAWIDTLLSIDPGLRAALWPQEPLHLWSMGPDEMLSVLYAMVRPTHEHFDMRREASLRLAVFAPGGPPRSGAELLKRLSAPWLHAAYGADRTARPMIEAVCTRTTSTAPAVEDTHLKYANLLARLDGCFDGKLSLADLDVAYCVVPGTQRGEVARARAAGVVSMVVDALAGPKPIHRKITLIVDEFSAVSGIGGIGIVSAVERLRSLGGSVVVAAQSWAALADTDTDRRRLVAAASGGTILMRTSHPDPVTATAGAHLVDPDRVRTFLPGDFVYLRSGAATYGRVAALSPVARRESAHELVTF